MRKFPWPTMSGKDLYEVMSAMQKCIRRGLEKEALYWASELYLSEYEDHAWSRFQIIASEDIGIADSNVAVQIKTLHDRWKDRKKDPDSRLYFVHALLILVRARKSRLVDHALMTVFAPSEDDAPPRAYSDRPQNEIPDWAYDKHTRTGREMGRGVEHFFEEGAKLENRADLPDPYEAEAKERRLKAETQTQQGLDQWSQWIK